MSSFKDLVKKVNEQKKAGSAYTQNQRTDDEEEKKHSSFRDLVKNVNNGTIQVGSKLNSSQVSDWYNGIKTTSQDGYSYLSKEGYKAPNTELADKVNTFLSQSNDVGQYIRANKSSFENYEEAYNSYVDTVNYLREFQKSLNESNDYYSMYQSEDDYIKRATEASGDRQKRYRENLKKIEELKAQRSQASGTSVYNPDSNFMMPVFNPKVKQLDDEIKAIEAENRKYERGEDGYVSKAVDDHSIVTRNSDFAAGSANRNYKNPNREEIELADAMNDSSTWYFDANGVYRDAFGNELAVDETNTWYNPASKQTQVEDKLALYLNTSEDERVAGAMDADGTRDGMWSSVMTEGFNGAWEYLTEKEKDIYYYYLYESQGKADKYLADMEVELNRRRTLDRNGQWRDAYDESNLLMKIAMNIATVPAKFASTVTGTIDNAVNTLTGNDINPYSMAHGGMHFSQTIRGATAEDLDATGIKIPVLDFTLGDLYQTGMSRLDSALATTIFGGGGTVFLGMGAAQEEAYRLYQQGASAEQITLGAFSAGAAEAVFEYVSFDKLVKMGNPDTIWKWAKSALIQGGIEASEETFTEISNIITNAVIMGQQSDLAKLYEENGNDWSKTGLSLVKQVANAAFGGFIGGLGAGVTQGGKGYINTQAQYNNTGKSIMGAEGGVDALKQLANDVAGVSDAKMQKTINKQVENVESKATARKIGRLYDTVQTANNQANASANQADIAKSLERKGFNTETANDIAEALVAEWNGQELTKAQEKLLKSAKESKVVQDAISSIVTNEQSTMGQRNQNIRSFERGVYEGIISKAINEAAVNNATEKQFTPSGDYAVSKDGKATAMVTEEVEGKTITKDTGEVINIQGIASIRKGEMLLDIGDGKTINSKDVAYATKNDALIYESIASLGDNINAETANKLIGKYKGGNALVFARGIAQAYTYGFYGIDRSELTGKRSLTTELTEDQRNFAYGLGERYRPIKDANDKIEASKKLAKSGKTPSEKGVYYRDKDGNATDISTYLKESNIQLNDLQKTGIEAMRKMSKIMGVRFNVFESWVENGKSYYRDQDGDVVEGNPNGFYDTTTGEIYIDLNAGNDYQGTMLFTIAHEVTHFMRQWSPEHFTKIAKIVFQHGGMKGNVSELVALKQARAKAKGKPISYDVAMEEVVADGMETILKDGKVVEFMADVKKQDHAAWKKLKGWFQNLAKFLRKMAWAYSSQSAQTTEGAMVAEFSQDLLSQIERIFAEGAVASGENYSRVESIVGQINIFLDEIMALDTVDTIDSSNATPYTGNRKVDEISGRDAFKAQGSLAIRPGFGRVHIGKKGAVNTVFHGNGPAKQAAFPAIKAVIENGIEIARDYNHDGLGFDTITFSAPIKFYGKKSPLAVVVKVFESVNANKTFYIHEICDAQGNYIQMDGTEFEQKNSSTNLVEPTSTASAADGNNPNTNIHNDSEIVKSESAEALDLEVDEKTESVAPTVLNSERTWTESDYVQEREQAAKDIAKAIGVSVKKAKAYIDSVNGIAKMIAEDRVRLDYFSSPGRSSFVSNVEYGGSFDFSTLCKKRRLLTGTFTAIQKALPNTALTADEILNIRNRMKKAGLEVSCGLCYVEGSRANMGQFAKEFLKLYKQYYPDAWQPNMADVNTPDGIEWVRINHPECYEQYEYFWNHYGTLKPGDKNLFASQQKPKLYQLHTEYKGEVLDKFKDDNNVEEKNLNGGIRLQSFSDFEIVHLIDTMQIIMDMSRVGLSGQAYTKVPDFAWALGDTGLKINLSLIAKGVDENGKLIFDDVEGMPIAEAMKLRDRYSKNVGTILVAFNDEQLLAAMADDRVDFIIPFHRSQWKKSQYEAMGLPAKTKDYTYMQNEKFIKPQYHEYRGRMVKDKATNYMPNEYWDFSKSGKENAEAYLEMCARNNKRPKFYKLLQNNGDGSYSLKADGSTDGYWKLLIDFKMYDNDGKGSPQMPVKPEFNMDEAQRMLNDYQGGHSNFPVAQGVVDSFVEEYKDSHKGALYSDRVLMGSLFSGGGTLEAGLAYQMLDKQFGVEYDGKIASVYADNHGDHIQVGRVEDFDISKYDDIFYLHASPVCHNFSAAKHGAKELAMDIASAKATAKHLETAMPQVFTVENAPGYRKSESLKIITDKLTELGYKWDVDVYNSADYGSATSRNRVILRAVKDGELPAKPVKQERTNSWDKVTRDLWDTLPKATLRPSFISAIENTRNLPILDANGKVNVNKPLLILTTTSGHTVTYCWEGDICPTLTTKCGEARLVMPDGNIYAVTPEFMGRIQGLPDDYKYPKEKTRAFTIIGNGIPTHLTKAVVGGVLDSAYEQTHDGQVLYQDRADESVSNRSLLANAFEGLAKDDIEKNKIQEYKSKIDLINSEEKKLSELNAQIKELSFSKGPRDTKKIRDLQFEAQQAANRINTYDKQLLRLEASKPLQDVLAREKKLAYKKAEQRGKEALDAYKERVAKTQRELLERWQENRKTAVAKVRETAEKRDAREKLNKLVLDTAKWISYPAKADVKCPDILKQPYTDFLNSIDLSSKRVANGGDPTKNDLRLANAMGSLATALDRIMTAQDPTQDSDKVLDTGYLDLPADFVQKLRDMTENIKAMMVEGDYVVNNMTASEVRQLSQMIRTLNHAIKTMSKLYANLRFANIEALGFDTMEFMDALGEIEKTSDMKGFVQWDNALPYYAFKRFGKGGESVFEGLMDAQDKLAFLAKEIFAFQEKTWTGKEAKAWSEDTHTITLPNGNELTLTTADAMSIYCLSRREQGLQHLLGGGTRVMGLQKGSQKAKDSRSMLTIEDVSAIISTLTDRQKQVAEGIQEFMSTVCSEWGNEISMKRFLTRDFSEKHYFPIESNDENLPTKDPAAQQSDLFRLLNISATKPLTPGANNEVIIRNVFDVFTGHASDMARLNAYGMALLDYMKWLNYREKTVTDEGQVDVKGVRKSMEKAFGNAAKSYVLNLVKDVNGRPSDGGLPSFYTRMLRNAKTAMVGNSLRVATLQITSYPRAALVLSPKSLTLGLSKLPNINKAKQYCGIALWKSFGFYDTNISRSIEDQMKGVKDVKQKLIELSLKGAEWGDAITWGALWNACEYEVASTKKFKVGTEEFYQEVGKKLREVVYRTQVVDSTLTRSEIMRSKNTKAQELSAFMSEPTLSANILMDAGFEFTMEKRRSGSAKVAWKKTGSYIGRAVAVYAIGQLTAALLEGFWDAWRDDEDEEFKEKYIDAFVENLVLDLAPFNKIPIISDLAEAAMSLVGLGYFSSDNLSSTALSQTVSAVSAWKDALSGESSVTVYNALYKTTRAISSSIGVAISGVMREGVALWNNTAGAYDSTLKIRTWDLSNADLGAELYEAIISGNTRQADSIKAQFEDTDAMHSAIRKALRENDPRIEEAAVAGFNGDPSERVRIAKLIIADGFEQDDVVMAINAEVNEMEPDEPKGDPKKKGFYTAEDFATEIANGDQASANAAKDDIIQTAVKNGKTQKDAEEAFASSAKTAFRKMFVEGTLNESRAAEALKTYCPTKDGPMDDDDIYWTLKEWKNEKSTGSSDGYGKYNDFHTAVQTGKNLKEVIKEYTDHGVEAKTLASQITSYFKPLYKEMSNTERAGIKGYLLNAYQLLGYNRSEKSKDIDKWLKD